MYPGHRCRPDFCSVSDSDIVDSEYSDLESSYNGHSQSLSAPQAASTGLRTTNYMVLRTSSPSDNPEIHENVEVVENSMKDTLSFNRVFNSLCNRDSFVRTVLTYLNFLSGSQRIFWLLAMVFAVLYFYPLTCIVLVGTFTLIMLGGHQNGNNLVTTRTAKWTITGYSYQMKDDFLTSPPFLDKCGQWRMIIKQKRGIEGLQTSLGLMCTDIFPEIELVHATVTFFCTNLSGQEVATGGMRDLKFHHEYMCPGDCGYTRYVRLPRKLLGQSETITVHCTVEFRKQMVTVLKTLVRRLECHGGDEEPNHIYMRKKGKNTVNEEGIIQPGNLEFEEGGHLASPIRSVMRFVRHAETKTFVWELPQFCSQLKNSELWGVYSPQFFVNSHDTCAIWRMKLLEVQGVFRLHVQLRGLPRSVKQVKLWYLLQLVDMHGDSIIPEHATYRIKYPDHMNLWDTSRHILYRRETILERFIGGNSGSLTLRISLQMQPNDVSLMEVDSDEWITNPNKASLDCQNGTEAGNRLAEFQGLIPDSSIFQNSHKMIAN